MKEIKVKFKNIWDNSFDFDKCEIIIFKMPKEMNIDVKKETKILDMCHIALTEYDCNDEEELTEALQDYDITKSDLEIAKIVLADGDYGVIASRIADFISKKYPNTTWEHIHCDVEVDIT